MVGLDSNAGLSPAQPLEMLLGTYPWQTAVRGLERQLEISASTVAQRATLELLGRVIYPDPVQGMGLLHALPELGGAEPLAAALPGDL